MIITNSVLQFFAVPDSSIGDLITALTDPTPQSTGLPTIMEHGTYLQFLWDFTVFSLNRLVMDLWFGPSKIQKLTKLVTTGCLFWRILNFKSLYYFILHLLMNDSLVSCCKKTQIFSSFFVLQACKWHHQLATPSLTKASAEVRCRKCRWFDCCCKTGSKLKAASTATSYWLVQSRYI